MEETLKKMYQTDIPVIMTKTITLILSCTKREASQVSSPTSDLSCECPV